MAKQQLQFDPHLLVSQHISSGSLDKKDEIKIIFENFVESKIKISTLRDVFLAFSQSLFNVENLKFQSQYNFVPLLFKYETKMWKGTVTFEESIYANQKRKFINFKLPNDSFIYTPTYRDTQSQYPDDLIVIDETRNLVSSMALLVEKIDSFEYSVLINYKENEGRLEVYFEGIKEPKTITFKFEYGTYEYFDGKKSYSQQEIQKWLDMSQKE